jgi:protein-ribulosamine 3-kinase
LFTCLQTPVLPSGTKIRGIRPHAASLFARTAKIEATDSKGEETNFFLKVSAAVISIQLYQYSLLWQVHQFELGKDMMSSEYKSSKLLHDIIPQMTAEPIGWGAYKESPDAYFFVCRYCDMSGQLPDVAEFTSLVADFHRKTASVGGEFGLPYTVYGGDHPLNFPVTKSWEETFSRGIEQCFNLEEKTHGRDEEMGKLRENIMTLIIPRLLRPLETEGRAIVPTFVHGDLWDGNASMDLKTGHPMVIDPAPLWAHNECKCNIPFPICHGVMRNCSTGANEQYFPDELAPWWAPRHKLTDAYIAEYIKHYPVSEPVEDFEDRGALYNL